MILFSPSLHALPQLVESSFLWKLHDLRNNEAEACDGIHLIPSGLDGILHVKPQQYAMHCDAIKEEIKLVMILITLQQTILKNTSVLMPTQIKIHPAVRTLQNF